MLSLLALIALVAAAPAPSTQDAAQPPHQDAVSAAPHSAVGGLDHIGLTVSDLSASRAFFENVLGFRVRGEDKDYPAFFMTNDTIGLTLWAATEGAAPFDRKNHVGLHHLALQVDSFETLDRLFAVIQNTKGTKIEFGPELSYGGPAKHMIFREPSGNRIELIHRP